MNSLRKYIRQILLTEAAKTPADLGDMHIEIEYIPNEWIGVTLWDQHKKGRLGEVQAAPLGEGTCSGAYEVQWANAEGAPGFGPMLYDIAMELAGPQGLMCDRRSVSQPAVTVWEFYLNNRNDVVPKQLDDNKKPFMQATPENPKNNDPADDCGQVVFRKSQRYKGMHNVSTNPEFKQKFLDHWSTKAYVKTGGTPVLDELKLLNKVKKK